MSNKTAKAPNLRIDNYCCAEDALLPTLKIEGEMGIVKFLVSNETRLKFPKTFNESYSEISISPLEIDGVEKN